MNHEEWLARADIYALGALDGEELDEFQAHLAAGCAACERHLSQSREALTLLPRSLAPITPPPGLKARLLSQIDGSAARHERPWLPRLRWGFGAGLVAAGLLILLSWNLISTQKKLDQISGQLDALRFELAKREEVIDFLTNPQTRLVSLAGLAANPSARGLLLWNPGSRTGILVATNLAALPPETVYELWAIAGNQPIAAGLFTLDAQGRALVKLAALPEGPIFDKFAVTLEPAGGVPKPTGAMHLLGSL
jgi:anti-sigma-K factor RskA